MKRFLLPVLLALTVGALYVPLARYGYVHDDNVMIGSFAASGMPDLSPVGTTFYRPLGTLYCYAVYVLFGMNTAGFHVLAMLFLFATASVVRCVAREISGDDVVAWASAFLYAAAANLHLDAQMWMVGIFDNGAVLASLLCLFALMRGMRWLSALLFAIALGFKESAAPILLVTAAWTLLLKNDRKAVLRLWPHALVLIAWIIAKGFGAPAASLPDDHPYGWAVLGWHVMENIGLYITWFVPVPFGFLIIVALMGWTIMNAPRTGVFLAIWMLLMLLPPSLLLQHAFRYYTLLALPAVAIGVVMGVRRPPVPHRWQMAALIAIVAAQIITNLLFVQGHVQRGINDDVPARDDGYNHLIRRSLQGE